MEDITLEAVNGERRAFVRIIPMLGYSSFHFYVDRFYWGAFNLQKDKWVFYGNDYGEAELTTADREIIADMILGYLAKVEA